MKQKFTVSVEKRLYCTGTVEVSANTPDEAIEIVQKKIDSGSIQTNQIEWDDSEYEDCSFTTTGDVE